MPRTRMQVASEPRRRRVVNYSHEISQVRARTRTWSLLLRRAAHSRAGTVRPESVRAFFFAAAVCSRDYGAADEGEAAQGDPEREPSADALLEDDGAQEQAQPTRFRKRARNQLRGLSPLLRFARLRVAGAARCQVAGAARCRRLSSQSNSRATSSAQKNSKACARVPRDSFRKKKTARMGARPTVKRACAPACTQGHAHTCRRPRAKRRCGQLLPQPAGSGPAHAHVRTCTHCAAVLAPDTQV